MAEGDGTSRNFRSAYYEKLGFCGSEEKNILDLLIASSSLDLDKLSDLCERFDLDRRTVDAWKNLLGVDCGRKNPFDDFANVRRVRAEHFQSLKHHLEVLLRHNLVINGRLKSQHKSDQIQRVNSKLLFERHDQESQVHQSIDDASIVNCDTDNRLGLLTTEKNDHASENLDSSILRGNKLSERTSTFANLESNPGKLITSMYLLEAGRLEPTDIIAQLDSAYCRKLSAMASFFANVTSDHKEAFFIFRNFVRKLEENGSIEDHKKEVNEKINSL